ncbi:MAG: MFS transporter [Oscillatoriales cyanobacterium C42_A2020_001]|nr:MFS transporter [Leptolyngbyaceae cyanobacterium C42_A2020_001]
MSFNIPALRSKNYRLFFGGQGLSLIGSWMTQVATIWLVYQLTNSALILGIVGFTGQIPSFVLAPFGGVLVDRRNPHQILIVTQILAMLQSLALATLTLMGVIQIWHILILSFCQGLINAFDAPARQTFVKDLVERPADLASAIALNSSLVNGARLVGPAIAGIIIARIGTGFCFLVDGISYIAVIAALLAMHLPRRPTVNQGKIDVLQWIREGFEYAFGFPPIRAILLLMAIFSLSAMSYTTLVPIFATEVLQGDAHTLGFLMAASGIGALMGGIYLTTRTTVVGLGKVIMVAPALAGAGLIAFALSRNLSLSLLCSLAIGLGSILQIAASNTVLQTVVEDSKRGRVLSLFTMAFLGVVPFGNLLFGVLASRIGAPATLVLGGSVCLLASFVFSQQLPNLRKLVKPIYQQAGILP